MTHRDVVVRFLAISMIAGCCGSPRAVTPPAPGSPGSEVEINRLLDAFHHAAAVADEEVYFGLLAEDSVFLGTDATERWNKAQFAAWAMPWFQRDSAWIYASTERHVSIAPCGTVAWFDETLSNDRYGVLRGTGVATLGADGWRLSQYNLTFLVPNERAADVVKVIQSQPGTARTGGDS